MPSTTRQLKREQDQALQAATEQMTTPQDSKSAQKLPLRSRDDIDGANDAVPSSSLGATPSARPKGQLVVFGDDDNDMAPTMNHSEVTPPKRTQVAASVQNGEGDEDSGDDAPEAVSTHQAAADLKRSSQVAQKAAQQQAAQQKRKRQQRDALFKQQASERQQGDDQRRPQVGRRRSEKLAIPDVLPAGFLTDSSSEDEDEDGHGSAGAGKSKRRKVATVEKNLVRLDKDPKDQILGSTVYRIAKQGDERMPPRARKHAKSTKALLLKRGRTAVKPKAGFFTNKR